jgi:pimeloyl-ACP methyl ester carboxylesterase
MRTSIRHVRTRFGDIAYTQDGEGPPALFVHGVFLNGFLWRGVIERVAGQRRCIAIDLLAHGETRTAPEADLSFDGNAEMLEAVCEALDLQQVDLVGNDSGGGIAQIFAARYPHRIRSLTLTNCDAHDNWPPKAFLPIIEVVRSGRLREVAPAAIADPEIGRRMLAVGYEQPAAIAAATIQTYLEPLFRSPDRIGLLERWFDSLNPQETVAAEPGLKRLSAPALIVWGDGDVFFDVRWAHWLHATLPGARPPVILQGAKLFFPEERPEALAQALGAFWSGAPSAAQPSSEGHAA